MLTVAYMPRIEQLSHIDMSGDAWEGDDIPKVSEAMVWLAVCLLVFQHAEESRQKGVSR